MPLEFVESEATISKSEVLPNNNHQLGVELDVDLVSDSQELERNCQKLSEAAHTRRKSFLRWHAGLAATALCLFGVIAILLVFQQPGGNVKVVVIPLLTSCVAAILLGIGGYLRVTRQRNEFKRLVESLIEANSTRATGGLIDVLCIDDVPVTRLARRQLTHLAPRWTSEDIAALTPEQRTGLRRAIDGMQTARHGDASGSALGHRNTAERNAFRIALITALGRLGDEEDLRMLRTVAHRVGGLLGARPVRDAAKVATQDLAERLAQANRPETLLRASGSPASAAEELLRATVAPGGTPPEQLLRSTSNSCRP